MIIFLYGEDSYRSKQKLNEIVGHYKKVRKSGLNLVYFDANQRGFADFYDNFKISPMFAEKKLVVLKNVFSNKKFQEDLLGEIKNLELFKDVIVIYEGDKVDQKTKIFKALKEKCKSQKFQLLDNGKLKDWARAEFKKYPPAGGQKINLDALQMLLRRTGNDLWRTSGEIKKLADFKNSSVIKREDIELMIKPKIEADIFKTIDALAAKNKKQALELMQRHLEAGENPLYLISMIAYQFRNLLAVKELAEKRLMYASIVQKSGLHPFVVKKSYFACSQFSFGELKNAYKKIFQIDLDIKTGKIEPEIAISLLVFQI